MPSSRRSSAARAGANAPCVRSWSCQPPPPPQRPASPRSTPPRSASTRASTSAATRSPPSSCARPRSAHRHSAPLTRPPRSNRLTVSQSPLMPSRQNSKLYSGAAFSPRYSCHVHFCKVFRGTVSFPILHSTNTPLQGSIHDL